MTPYSRETRTNNGLRFVGFEIEWLKTLMTQAARKLPFHGRDIVKGTPILTARNLYFSPNPVDRGRQEDLEREFFNSIKLKNGTYKSTYSNRLDDLSEVVTPLLPRARPLQVMDVAISSGITTLNWMESLERAGVEHHMTAGDLTLRSYIVSIGRYLHVLVDKTGCPLQFDILGHAVPNPPGPRRSAIYFLPLLVLNIALRRFPAMRAETKEDRPFERSVISCRQIALVSPRLKRFTNLKLIEDDIINDTNLTRSFHVIRAANILQRGYFGDSTLTRIITNLRCRLLDGGLLTICKTEDPPPGNTASVYKLNGERRFEIIASIGGGSKLDDLVLHLSEGIS